MLEPHQKPARPRDETRRGRLRVAGAAATTVTMLLCLAQAHASPGATGMFRVEGTRIYDPNGNHFIPVGGNMNGYNWGWNNRTLTDRHLDSFVNEWGFNTVRLNNYIKGYHRQQQYWQYGDFKGTYTVNNDLEAIIDAYTSRGVVVMLEAHDWTGTGIDVLGQNLQNHNGVPLGSNHAEVLENPFTQFGGRTHYDSQYDILVDFFSHFAVKYKDNPYVWFNPLNEPGTVLDSYRNSNNQRIGHVPDHWVETHGRFIQDMRALGFNNPIVIDGIAAGQDHGAWWGDTQRGLRPETSAILSRGREILNFGGEEQENVLFALHVYHQMGHSTPAGQEDLLVQWARAAQDQDLAVIIGEAGWYGNQPNAQPAVAYRRLFEHDLIVGGGMGLLAWHLQPGDGMALVHEGTFSRVNHPTNPTNLTWMGEPLWNLVIPEPSSLALLGIGAGFLLGRRRAH